MVKRDKHNGFTLIELLVALAILGIIVVICGRIFEQSNVSWNTGARKAEVNMVGRGVANFIAQDLSRCIARTPADLNLSGNSPTFKILDESSVAERSVAKPLVNVVYDLTALTRNGVKLAPDDMLQPPVILTPGPLDDLGIPGYVDVDLRVRDSDGVYTVDFKSRAWLANRDRYRYDE
jgi:prepilin-type N-terminal cleavage/methylation domain-containing protein